MLGLKKHSGRRLSIEVNDLNCKGLRPLPFQSLYSLLLPVVLSLTILNFALDAQAKKHSAQAQKKSTAHAAASSSNRTAKTGRHSRVSEAPSAGRHRHGVAAVSEPSHKGHGHSNHTAEARTKTIKTVHVVRDRRGRVVRRETRETVVAVDKEPKSWKHHTPLQKEEHVVSAKEKVEPQSPPENQETPSEYHDFQKAYALYDEGTNARLAGNYSEAISCISRALSMVPSNAHGGPSVLVLNMEYDLAQAAESSGDLQLAARYFARALSDRPNFPEASVHLARVLAQNGKFDEALRAARDGVARSPSDARTHSMLALLLGKNGQSTEANIENRKAQSLINSNNSRSYVQPGPGSSPSFKTSTQNTQPVIETAPVNPVGVDDDATGANKGSSKNSEDEGFTP